jgi:hypothetical protein
LLYGGTLWTKVLTIYHTWIHPFIILLYPPSPILGIVSIFSFHTWMYNISTIFTFLHPFPYVLPPPTCTSPQVEPVLPSCSVIALIPSFPLLSHSLIPSIPLSSSLLLFLLLLSSPSPSLFFFSGHCYC